MALPRLPCSRESSCLANVSSSGPSEVAGDDRGMDEGTDACEDDASEICESPELVDAPGLREGRSGSHSGPSATGTAAPVGPAPSPVLFG